jgi:hypothetical protein
MRARHDTLFAKFSGTFDADLVKKWEDMVEVWDGDQSKPNPYEDATIRKYRRSCDERSHR